MADLKERIIELFEQYVPQSGKADTVGGEIIRALMRIEYRNYNDGDHLNVGYGKETCNPAGRFLGKKCGPEVGAALDAIDGERDDDKYDAGLEVLDKAVLDFLDEHPELFQTANDEDMWDSRDPAKDVDDYEDEEEEEDDYEEEYDYEEDY